MRSDVLPEAVQKRWRTKVSAYKRAIAKLEAGYTDDLWRAAVRARDALDAAIWDATAHVPYAPGAPASESTAIKALEAERRSLVASTFQRAQEIGQLANAKARDAEVKRLRDADREARRPYDWMRK